MTDQPRSYQEGQEFAKLLEAEFAATGMDAYSRASARWEHHMTGVQRVLDRLSYLEPHLNRPLSQARVLDLGCATGSASVAFAWSGCSQVFGLDVALGPLGLKLAHQRARLQNLTARFIQGDGVRLPFASNTFDFCFCDWVIEHTPRPLALLQELRRVMAGGGLLYVSTNNRLWPKEAHSGLWLIGWLPHVWAGKIAARLGHWPRQEYWDIRLLTQWQLLSLARKAGLEILGTRKDILPPETRPFPAVFRLAARLGVSLDAISTNLYLLARKPQ